MGKVKKGVKKFQKKIAGGGVHKKKKLHFRRDKAEAVKAAAAAAAAAVSTEPSKSNVTKPGMPRMWLQCRQLITPEARSTGPLRSLRFAGNFSTFANAAAKASDHVLDVQELASSPPRQSVQRS